MSNWLREFLRDLTGFVRHVIILAGGGTRAQRASRPASLRWVGLISWCVLILLVMLGARSVSIFTTPVSHISMKPRPEPGDPALMRPVRDEPRRFKANTHMPGKGEGRASGSINLRMFFPKYDLVRIEDDRVWWESEHDKNDTEDDHIVHRSLEEPLRRLIELTAQHGAQLEVQDAYRPTGVHSRRSLHKEGRAIDLTCKTLGLEKLAKLCWAAGFDWVYYEAPKRGGAHIHCSVRADR